MERSSNARSTRGERRQSRAHRRVNTARERRRGPVIALWSIVIVAVLAGTFVATALATDRSAFCASCHEMRPYYDAWAAGPHHEKACIDCHVNPGVPARLAHKFVALKEVYSHFTGDTKFPRAVAPELPNARCERCHDNLPDKLKGGFPHAMHASKGRCAQCHYDAGHAVTDAALESAGIFDPNVKPARLSLEVATVGGGKANLPEHKTVACSKCHDMAATACSACHVAPTDEHPVIGKQDCSQCHKPGAKFAFAHPSGSSANCVECHKQPGNHPKVDSTACVQCHRKVGVSWAFAHPSAGEHSWKSRPCKKCHPQTYAQAYCTCHKGNPPRD